MKRQYELCACALAFFLWLSQTSRGQPVLWSANGHYYELVPQNLISWYDARTAAGTRAYAGLPAHLATITSAAENEFITTNFSSGAPYALAWIGGHAPNDQIDGVWQWEAGPEAGIQFAHFKTPTPPFNYANWGGIEPNHDKANEDFLMFNIGAPFPTDPPAHATYAGQWGDAAPYPNPSDPFVGYIVEYEPVNPPATNCLNIKKVLQAYQLSFFAEANKSYQIQYKEDIGNTNWINLGDVVLGDGATKAVFDATSDSVSRRFYRLLIGTCLDAPQGSLDYFASGHQSDDLFDLANGVNEFAIIYDNGNYYLFYHDADYSTIRMRYAPTIAGLASAFDNSVVLSNGAAGVVPAVIRVGSTFHLYVGVVAINTTQHFTSSSLSGPWTYSDTWSAGLGDPYVAQNPIDGNFCAVAVTGPDPRIIHILRSSSASGPWTDEGNMFSGNISVPSWAASQVADPTIWFKDGRMFGAMAGWDGSAQRVGIFEINPTSLRVITGPIIIADPTLAWQQTGGVKKVFNPYFMPGNAVDTSDRIYFAHNPSAMGVPSGWAYVEARACRCCGNQHN